MSNLYTECFANMQSTIYDLALSAGPESRQRSIDVANAVRRLIDVSIAASKSHTVDPAMAIGHCDLCDRDHVRVVPHDPQDDPRSKLCVDAESCAAALGSATHIDRTPKASSPAMPEVVFVADIGGMRGSVFTVRIDDGLGYVRYIRADVAQIRMQDLQDLEMYIVQSLAHQVDGDGDKCASELVRMLIADRDRLARELTEARTTIANLAHADRAIRDARAAIDGHCAPIDQLRADPEILDMLGLCAAVDSLVSQYEEAAAALGSAGPYGLAGAARAVVAERDALRKDARGDVLRSVREALRADPSVSAAEAAEAMRDRAETAEARWAALVPAAEQAERAAKALGCTVAKLGESAERHAARFAKLLRAVEDYVHAKRDASPGGASALVSAYERLLGAVESAPVRARLDADGAAKPKTVIVGHAAVTDSGGSGVATASEWREGEKRVALAAEPSVRPVPRDHCDRCDRCGWPFDGPVGCLPGNCSRRPLPELRTHCAGCGAPYERT